MTARERRERLERTRLYVVAPAVVAGGRPLPEMIPALAAAGVDLVQLRERGLPADELRAVAERCAVAARRAGLLFLVNDDPGLARAVGADGVHLGQADADGAAIRRLRADAGDRLLIGRSTRGGDDLEAAAAEGADYAAVGPVWETPTKPGREAIGPRALASAARRARLPWFAIGGIDERRALRVGALGAERIIVVRAVCDVADPPAAAAALLRRLERARPRVLSVAGSDSGGGAGIQADIKAIVAAGGFPMCAVTALTAQNTQGVSGVEPSPLPFVSAQIAAVAEDIGIDGLKTGMLGTGELVERVCSALDDHLAPEDEIPVVADTVLRAESGAPLMAPGGEEAIARELLPRATVITPNLMEAQALAGIDEDDPARLAATLHERHGCAVIVTGGHGRSASDFLHDAHGPHEIPGQRLPVATTHGAGCTHSSTLATLLAAGLPLRDAAAGAKRSATAAVAAGLPFGAGPGPVDVTATREERLWTTG